MTERTPVAVGVDVGGTFTDVALLTDEGLLTWKIPSSSPQTKAVVEGLKQAEVSEETRFLHGTTVATNALLEGTSTTVALVTSPGFEDLIEIARQKRPSLYDLSVERPVPLVDRSHRIGHRDPESTIAEIASLQPDAVALTLLHSYLDSSTERSLAALIRERLPNIPLSVGSELSPEFREYERTETTVVNAYLTPVVSGYLSELSDGASTSGSFVMTSSGGLLSFPVATKKVGQLTLSGPAAGAVAADALRVSQGLESVIAFDMGGTSTDVCRIGSDGVPVSASQAVGGRTNRVASVPIHTVGAGGGSIAWRDGGGSLRVGPRSAGAAPGPAAYGQGGTEPTVTDANVFLGYIRSEAALSGGLEIDADAARRSIDTLAGRLGLSAGKVAAGIIEVSDSHISRAIRVVSIEEGFDTRQSTLVAYGGAGGLHASRIARSLEMRSVMIPANAGVFSALGLLLARPRSEVGETLLEPASSPSVAASISRLRDEVRAAYVASYQDEPASVEVRVDCRYVGQSHELSIDVAGGGLEEQFESAHEQRFGFDLSDVEIEVVNVRAIAVGNPPTTYDEVHPDLSGRVPRVRKAQLVFDGQPDTANVYERSSLPAGFTTTGPAIIFDDLSTSLIGLDDTVAVLDDGSLEITW